MNKLTAVIALATLLTPAIASAELSYDDAQLSFAKLSKSGGNDLNMTYFNLSKGITSNVFLDGKYGTGKQATGTSFGDATAKEWAIGAGYHTPIQTNTDFIITGRFRQVTASLAGVSVTGDSRVIEIGIRTEFTPQFEGSLGANYASSSVGSSTSTATTVNAELGFKVTPQFQFIAGLGAISGGSTPTHIIDVGARYFY